jgi:hypothetical protein
VALGSFLTPTVVHFAAILFACLLACIPWRSEIAFGVLLGAGALAGLLYSGTILSRLVFRRTFKADLSDRLFYAVIPVIGYLALLSAAVLLSMRSPLGVDLIAAALLILLSAAIRNAWDMTFWTATKSPSDSGSAPRSDGAT